MTDLPFVENDDMPYPHNPIRQLPRLNRQAESDVFRFDTGHEQRLADWCSGTVAVEGADLVVETGGTPSTTARVGDYVVRTYGDEGSPWYVTVSEELYPLIWWPKGYVPGWDWRCYQPWDQPQPDWSTPTPPDLGSDDFPHVHNPIDYLPWLDSGVEVQVFQLRPTLESRLAEWCGGEVVPDPQVGLTVRVPGAGIARLGDFVLFDGTAFSITSSDGFNQRFWPVGRDPGFSFTCYYQGAS